MCSRIESQGKQRMLLARRKKNDWKSKRWRQFNKFKKHNLDRRATHIHGGMEHNLVGYAKYYSYGSTKILGGNEFTRKINYNKRDFYGHW
jgi:hypothetical protein